VANTVVKAESRAAAAFEFEMPDDDPDEDEDDVEHAASASVARARTIVPTRRPFSDLIRPLPALRATSPSKWGRKIDADIIADSLR
jgi:hypothetical protein